MNKIVIEQNQRNNSLDVLKFILAVFVVFRHTPSAYQLTLMPITTCAVPVFFMVSGYLMLYRPLTTERLLKGAKRIALILLYAALFYYIFYYFLHNCFYKLSVKDIVVFLTINDVPFAGHLWYLSAYVYVLLALTLIKSFKKQNLLFWIIPVLVLFYLAADVYYIVIKMRHSLTMVFLFRSWLFTGLPFFCFGALLHMKPNAVPKTGYSMMMLVVCLALAVLESLFFGPENHISDVFFTTWPLCFCLFVFFERIYVGDNNIIAKWGQKYSLYIYLFHPAVIPLVKNNIGNNVAGDYFQPLIVLLITFLLSTIYVTSKTFIKSKFSKQVQ